ncbi:MAG: hypothetical protein ABI882_23060 [Acidobacteriota bacterium]
MKYPSVVAFFSRAALSLVALVLMTLAARAADPGLVFTPLTDQGGDDRRGSLLIFNIYTSSPSNPATTNTRMSITNVNDQNGIAVHLFFVDGDSCSIADRYVCLTQSQTVTLLASEQDPGTSGYMIALATDPNTGTPSLFNSLIGDEFVKFQTGHFASLGAEAYAKFNNTNVVSTDGSLAALFFDGLNLAGSYQRMARVVAVDNIADPASGNATLLILNRIGGDLTTSAARIGSLFGILYDDAEQPHSFSGTGGCQLRILLTNNFPRTTPRFDVVIPAGQSGWMKLWATSDVGLTGAVINSTSGVGAGSFSSGHNLHKLTLTFAPNLIIPIFGSTCGGSVIIPG